MIINVLSAKEAWASPDGKIHIWDITTAEGMNLPTFSPKIANGVGQSFEVTTMVKNGKTYFQIPKDDAAPVPAITPLPTNDQVARLEAATEAITSRLDTIIQLLGGAHQYATEDKRAPIEEPSPFSHEATPSHQF